MLKKFLKYIYVLPGMIKSIMAGFRPKSLEEYDNVVNFLRYFPWATFKRDGVAEFRFEGRLVRMFVGEEGPKKLGIFGLGEYSKLKQFVTGMDVVDLGAAFGDSAVLFGTWGAKNVYGYEINKRHAKMAETNIALNGLADNCEVFWCGVGNSTDRIDRDIVLERDMTDAKTVTMTTLDELTRRHEINGGILKIDVDGYEYEIIDKADLETLRKYDKVFMEFHYGVQGIVSKLEEAGFQVCVSEITKLFVPEHPGQYQNMEVGFIDASKITEGAAD